MVDVVLETMHLSKVLGSDPPFALISDVTLKIYKGEFVSIIGPSGSGKSSLLYLLGLLDTPTSGEIYLDKIKVSELNELAKADLRLSKIGFVFQFHFLLSEFTAIENVMIPMTRLGVKNLEEIKLKAYDLLVSLGLRDQLYKKPKQLSGGQSQRVAIARALANEPLLILADEPTGNLDSRSSEMVREIFEELALNSNTTIVTVTHDHKFSKKTKRSIEIIDGRISY
jgi:lipoprotein-releasing system ATP-binding protein